MNNNHIMLSYIGIMSILLRIYQKIKRKLFPVIQGPIPIKYVGTKRPDRYWYCSLTVGKIYFADLDVRGSYFLHDDNNHLHQVSKRGFINLNKERAKKLKKII